MTIRSALITKLTTYVQYRCDIGTVAGVLQWQGRPVKYLIQAGGTGFSGLTRGLTTLPQGGSRRLQWSETGMEDPQEDPLAVYCFCVCSGSALLGDLLGAKQIQGTWPSVCPVVLFWDFLVRIHCVSSHSKDSLSVVVFCYMLMCVGCFGLVISTCQVIGWKDSFEEA